MKSIYINLLTLSFISLTFFKATAQDVHFSQNYATPLLLNPAMTGLMQGDVRGTAVYRSQWGSTLDQPYRTLTLSGDVAFQGIGDNDRLAVGLMGYNDQTGTPRLTTNYIDANVAYNLGLNDHTYFSMGIAAGVAQRSIDLNDAQFGDQYDPETGEIGTVTETINYMNRWRFNVGGGGVFYIAPEARRNLYAGIAIFHLRNPDISFFDIEDALDQWRSKISFQVGGSYPLTKRIDLLPSVYMLRQGNFFKTDAGSFVRFIFSQNRFTKLDRAFNLGAWVRVSGSEAAAIALNTLVLAAKIDYENFGLGLSYDVNLAKVGYATTNRGGVEVALTYAATTRAKKKQMYCPRF